MIRHIIIQRLRIERIALRDIRYMSALPNFKVHFADENPESCCLNSKISVRRHHKTHPLECICNSLIGGDVCQMKNRVRIICSLTPENCLMHAR